MKSKEALDTLDHRAEATKLSSVNQFEKLESPGETIVKKPLRQKLIKPIRLKKMTFKFENFMVLR